MYAHVFAKVEKKIPVSSLIQPGRPARAGSGCGAEAVASSLESSAGGEG
jgi:hypothetical protein